MTALTPSPPATPGAFLCPRCGTPLHDEQAWCVECGLAARTRVHPPPSWRVPIVATTLVLVLLAAGIALTLVALLDTTPPTPAAATVTLPATAPAPAATTPTTAAPTAPTATTPAPASTPTAPTTTTPPILTTPPAATTTAPLAPVPGASPTPNAPRVFTLPGNQGTLTIPRTAPSGR